MSLTLKEKELVALGASIAAGCKPCTNYHFKKAREATASDEEIRQAITDATNIKASSKEFMENHAFKLLGITRNNAENEIPNTITRIQGLIYIAAAFAVNCTSNLETHIAAARTIGITDDEIKSVLDMALFIKSKAASHVDRIAENIGNAGNSKEKSVDVSTCGCGFIQKAR